MKLTKLQRRELFDIFEGRCAYCGCQLPENGWHADHVEAIWREWWKGRMKITWEVQDGRLVKREERQRISCLKPQNDHIGNLFPSCRACNIDKAANTLEDWRAELERKVQVLRNNYSAFRHAERFGLVTVNNASVVFYFERVRTQQEAAAVAP